LDIVVCPKNGANGSFEKVSTELSRADPMEMVGTPKVAETLSEEFTETIQVKLAPVQAPDQPVKVEPIDGLAVRTTEVPAANVALHKFPQLMPPWEEVIVPFPFPRLLTARTKLVPASSQFERPAR
jgi:hypothetical protein